MLRAVFVRIRLRESCPFAFGQSTTEGGIELVAS